MDQLTVQTGGQRCRLLELPRELFDMIFLHVLNQDADLAAYVNTQVSTVRIMGRRRVKSSPFRLARTDLNLVCRQIREQTRGMFFMANNTYSMYGNSFASPSSYALQFFLKQMGNIAISRLRKVAVNGSDYFPATKVGSLQWKAVAGYLTSFKNLCITYNHVTIVVRFRQVADITDETWFASTLALRELICRERLLATVEGIEQCRKLHQELCNPDQLLQTLRNLPANLRFSILDEMPERTVLQQVQYGKAPATTQSIMAIARSLWQDGI